MRIKLGKRLLWAFTSLFMFSTCDLEKIEPGSGGNAVKFNTTVGGNANDFPNDLIVASDGGYVVVGYSQSFTGGGDNQAYIVKLGKQGNQEWENNFGGAKDDYARGVTATSDGGFILCGYTQSFNAAGNQDVFLVKVNAQGNKVWEKFYGAPDTTEVAYAIVPVGTAGDFMVAYVTYGTPQMVKLMRINANGSKISEKTVKTGTNFVYRMIKTSDNKLVLVGSESDSGTKTYILKLNEDGSFIWEKTFPATNTNYTPGYAVAELSNKNLVVAGSELGSNDHDFNLVAYNEIGGELWDAAWGGANADELFGIVRTVDNQLVVMGYSSSFSGQNEIYLSKRSSTDGSEIWKKNFINIGNLWGDVERCPDGGFVLCAGQNQANADIIVVKTDANGEYQ